MTGSFLAAGETSLATRSTDGEALETERLKAKLGEMLLERELDVLRAEARRTFTSSTGYA